MKYARNALCRMPAADSTDSETYGRREHTLDFTALKTFRKGNQIVGAVHHLSIDTPGFDNAFTPMLFQSSAFQPSTSQTLSDERNIGRSLWLHRCSKSKVDWISAKCVRSRLSKVPVSTR